MPDFFDSLQRSFEDVPVNAADNNAISTTEFLQAAESLTTLFDVLGSVAFKPVKSDMLGNVKKIRDRQHGAPTQSETLQALVSNELAAKQTTASGGLLWLTRGLDFTAQSLRHNVLNPSDELATSFRTAYADTLKPHHSFVVKPIFSAAMSATPYRKDFYAKLGDDDTVVQQKLEAMLKALERIVAVLNAFLALKMKERKFG